MIALLRYLLGYVRFSACGGFTERFYSECVRLGLQLWDPQKRVGCLLVCIRAGQYRRLRAVRRGCGVRLRIVRKVGLPFFMHRYRRRAALVIGALLFTAALIFMGQFIWTIEVVGTKQLTREDLLYALQRAGIGVGCPKGSVDLTAAEARLMLEVPELAWVSVYTRGTTLFVELRERIAPPEVLPQQRPCNVVSDYTAEVLRVRVYYGQSMVRAGEGVAKGQLLVSGVWENREGSAILVHARADILGRVHIAEQFRVPYEKTETVYTGRETVRFELSLFGKTLPLYFSRPSLMAENETQEKSLVLFGATFPIALRRIVIPETKQQQVVLSQEQALQEAQQRIADYELEEFSDAVIVSREAAQQYDADGLTVTVLYVCDLSIGREAEILLQ